MNSAVTATQSIIAYLEDAMKTLDAIKAEVPNFIVEPSEAADSLCQRIDEIKSNAQSVIDAVKKTLAINFASPNGNSYGFNKAMLSSGGDKSAFGD